MVVVVVVVKVEGSDPSSPVAWAAGRVFAWPGTGRGGRARSVYSEERREPAAGAAKGAAKYWYVALFGCALGF